MILRFPDALSTDTAVEPLPRTAAFLADREARQQNLRHQLTDTFRSQRKITLEIGAGHGHFLTAYAEAHPERFCVGIDIMNDRVARAGRKRERARLPNLVFLRAEATEFLAALPVSICLEDIFVLFPDPWPKRRHHKNRVMQPEFLATLAERAGQGSRLFFRTDYAPYFEETHKLVAHHPNWTLETNEKWPFELETVFQSRAEMYESLVARVK